MDCKTALTGVTAQVAEFVFGRLSPAAQLLLLDLAVFCPYHAEDLARTLAWCSAVRRGGGLEVAKEVTSRVRGTAQVGHLHMCMHLKTCRALRIMA
jgi:hypothetical protein